MKKLIFSFIFICIMSTYSSGSTIKHPNVINQFYTTNPHKLSSQIKGFFEAADVKPYDQHIEIIIVPHAGYMFSGGS